MAYTAPTVNYSTTFDGTYTQLTGIQSVSVTRGRQYIQDNFPQSTCTVELIPANSYATPLAIGQYIDVRESNGKFTNSWFEGKITDVQRTYGMPYTIGTGAAPADRIIITATGATGVIAANYLTNYAWTAGLAETKIDGILSNSGVAKNGQLAPNVDVSAKTFTGGALDAINQLLRTSQGVIDDSANYRTGSVLYCYIGNSYGFNHISFSDTGSLKFNQIEYQSSAQNTFNKVTVTPDGLAAQSVVGTAPFNALVYNTFNATTADASSLANYLYLMYSGQLTAVPFKIRTDTNIAPTILSYISLTYGALTYQSPIGNGASITFRGSTVQGIIQGLSYVFYPDYASVEFIMSPSLGQPFILDSTVFGVLDTNRLGYP